MCCEGGAFVTLQNSLLSFLGPVVMLVFDLGSEESLDKTR